MNDASPREWTIPDELPVALAEATLDGRLVRVNPLFRALFERAEADLVGHPLVDFVHPDDRSLHAAAWARLGRDGSLPSPLEARYLTPSGRAVRVSQDVLLVPGGVGRVLIVGRERPADPAPGNGTSVVTEDFLAVLSHELRSPLGAIVLWVRLLQEAGFDAVETQRALSVVERSAHALERMVEGILDVSRIVSGKLPLSPEDLDLRAVVDAAVASVAGDAALHAVALSWTAPADAVAVRGDRAHLTHAVANLLATGVKLTAAGGELAVSLEVDAGRAKVRLIGNGRMGAQLLAEASDASQVPSAAGIGKRQGSGLALYVIRHVLALHDGTLEAERLDAKHTLVTVSLPGHAITAVEEPAPSVFAQANLPPGLRILLVDDDQDTREAFRFFLERHGLAVETAGSADEAFERFTLRPPDILLSDIAMPERDGLSLIRQIRALPADRGGLVPAAALTAYAAAGDRVRSLAAGFQRHVAKPVDPSSLVAILEALLRKPAQG